MKRINGVRVLLESTRRVGNNPLDFLLTNHIQNGQFVSIGYLEDVQLSTNNRYINADNDAKLGEYIKKGEGSRFSRDFDNVRKGAKYQSALAGTTKTGTFELSDVHIVKLGRYNFQWKNAEAKRRDYEERELPLLHGIRQHYGFDEMGYDEEDTENWRNKKKTISRGPNAGHEKLVYGGNGIIPRMDVSDEDKGTGFIPVGDEGADFFQHENTKNISFRQVLAKNAMQSYQFFYVDGQDGILEPLDKDAYYFLAKGFSRERVNNACDELLADEKAYLQDLEELASRFNHRTFNWEKVLYMAGSTAGKDTNGKTVYEPFIWINDEAILATYPFIDKDSLEQLIEQSVRVSQETLDNWRKTPQVWENKAVCNDKELQEKFKHVMHCVGKHVWAALKEQYDHEMSETLNENQNLSYRQRRRLR